ncbi:MAG: preprotein translocase subunit SecA, partial [Candidatus Cloacimonetes bacterium]|nr:preprotein translocase subunit SecA [Candidatus Cloacimonadota bacterium]
MFKKLFNKIVGNPEDRALKRTLQIAETYLEKIKEFEPQVAKLTDDELRQRSNKIRDDIQAHLAVLIEQETELEREYHAETDDSNRETIGNKLDEHRKALRTTTQDILDEHLPEVFTIVKDTCRRLAEAKHSYKVRGDYETWFMIPFDEQLVGGIVLHKGMIAEMATGEGKTIVATLPLFLNAMV